MQGRVGLVSFGVSLWNDVRKGYCTVRAGTLPTVRYTRATTRRRCKRKILYVCVCGLFFGYNTWARAPLCLLKNTVTGEKTRVASTTLHTYTVTVNRTL